MENVFLYAWKKIIKHFAEKSLSVFGGAHGTPLNTLKLFMAFFLFYAYKNTFAIISRFISQKIAGII